MATFYSDQYTKTLETPKRRADSVYGGNVQYIADTYTVTAALEANQEIEFGTIPAGAKVLDVCLTWTDLHAGAGSPTIDFGYTGAVTAFGNGGDLTGAGGVRYAAATNSYVAFSAAKQLLVKILDAATDATSGSITVVCTYILD